MNISIDTHPWLRDGWGRLSAYLDAERFPQALMITGSAGLGKQILAGFLAKRLLCRNPGEFACDACASCSLFEAGTHPDFLPVAPAEPGKPITIDAVRSLIASLALRPQYSGHRVVILNPAHQMNTNAANSLLKTLEEPDRHTIMLLLTDRPSALPATILSRCQRLHLPLPPKAETLAFLRNQGVADDAEVLWGLAGGAPLRALELSREGIIGRRAEFFGDWLDVAAGRAQPVAVADKWSKSVDENLLGWLSSWTTDLIRLISVASIERVENPDLAARLKPLASRLHLAAVFGYFDLLNGTRRLLSGQANRQLVLEELLIRWARVSRP